MDSIKKPGDGQKKKASKSLMEKRVAKKDKKKVNDNKGSIAIK